MSKTNTGLVAYAQRAEREKWGYVYGTFGQKLTEALLIQKKKQLPEEVGGKEATIRKLWMGRIVTDCVGLIKSYIWFDGANVKYNPKTDLSANTMYSAATIKGPMSTIPDIPGILVWKSGHIGVYVGNGRVIEAHGTSYGVINTPLKGTGSTAWTNWCKCHLIEYETIDQDQVLLGLALKKGLISDVKLWGNVLKGTITPSPEWIRVLLDRATKL